jgi:hypothetical protein
MYNEGVLVICEACEKFQESVKVNFYEWRGIKIIIRACEVHFKEISQALDVCQGYTAKGEENVKTEVKADGKADGENNGPSNEGEESGLHSGQDGPTPEFGTDADKVLG